MLLKLFVFQTSARSPLYRFQKEHKELTLTLVPLLSKAPEEVVTERAEGGLSKEFCHKAVSLDFMNFLMFYRPTTSRDVVRVARFLAAFFFNAPCKKIYEWCKTLIDKHIFLRVCLSCDNSYMQLSPRMTRHDTHTYHITQYLTPLKMSESSS